MSGMIEFSTSQCQWDLPELRLVRTASDPALDGTRRVEFSLNLMAVH